VAGPSRRRLPQDPDEAPAGLAGGGVERSPGDSGDARLALVVWLHHHFVTRGLGLDLNAMNHDAARGAFALHRNVPVLAGVQGAVQICWPILVLYHLYGGVAGLLQYTTVGASFAGLFARLSTPLTFPLLTASQLRGVDLCPRAGGSGSCRATSR